MQSVFLIVFSLYLAALGGYCGPAPYAASAAADTTASASSLCLNPPVRKEWRQLTSTEKKAYINAVLCLEKKTAKSTSLGAVNRFDDFQAVHSDQTPSIHWVGHFILWHRYLVAMYEKALRNECGYTGGQPYWDWSLDASTNQSSTAIFETAIFDPVTGLGGNGAYVAETTPEENPFNLTGRTGGGCVQNGPFKYPAFKVNIPTPNTCLKRDFIPWIMNSFAQKSLVDNVVNQPDYASMAYAMEGIPSFSQPNIHGSGHFGVGGVLGTVGNAYNSPGDPIFYLHHCNLDRVLWKWQSKDLFTRLNQVGGPVTPFDYGGVNVTLDFQVNLGYVAPNATLKSLLNIVGGTLCYWYA